MGTRVRTVVVCLLLAACGGKPIGAGPGDGGTAGTAGAEAGLDGTGAAGTGVAGTGAAGTGAAGTSADVVGDPGFVGVRLLSSREYRNTVRDLLNVEARQDLPRAPYADFDNGDASVMIAKGERYQAYLEEAERLSSVVFAAPALRARVVACPTPAATAGECVRAIVPTLGQRAWRRPLSADEALSLTTLADEAVTRGASRDVAIQRALTALLSGTPFLYKIEVDPQPTSTTPHALTTWELATRLSYALWGTMPDDRLFALAADGSLARDEVFTAQVDRMLDDARADAIIEGFALPWLLSEPLESHVIDPIYVPGWNQELAAAMSGEFRLYVREFLRSDRSFATFPAADFNFVNAALARHYDMPADGLGDQLTRVEVATDRRRGILGLGGFLMASSNSRRTSVPVRGRIVLGRLLCVDIGEPPPDVPGLGDIGGANDPSIPPLTPRDYFVAVEQRAECGACHRSFDAYGFALEEMDQVGRLRATYPNGRAVDARGTLSDGTSFTGEAELADTLARDPRFLACTARKALNYATGRQLKPADDRTLLQIGTDWAHDGTTLRALFRRIVLDDAFRYRRGGAEPQ